MGVFACAFPCTDSPVEAVTGMRGDAERQDMFCVFVIDEFDTNIWLGTTVMEFHSATVPSAWAAALERESDCGTGVHPSTPRSRNRCLCLKLACSSVVV